MTRIRARAALILVGASVCGALAATAGDAAATTRVPLSAALGLRVDGHVYLEHLGDDVLARAGDFDGDGLDDVLVGAWATSFQARPPGRQATWHARIVLGRRGPAGRAETTASGRGVEIVRHGGLGISGGAYAGDVNGDGRGDVVLRADREEGRAWVVLGRPGRRTIDVDRLGRGGFEIRGARSIGGVASLGDVNRDGLDDVAVGEPAFGTRADGWFAGRVTVVFGARSPAPVDLAAPGPRTATIAAPPEAISFGATVAGAGDTDGDRVPDLVVGSPAFGSGPPAVGYLLARGAAYVVGGAALRPGATVALGPATGGWYRIEGTAIGDHVAAALAPAGDQDGDGLRDVVVGMFPGGALFASAAAPTGAWVVSGRAMPADHPGATVVLGTDPGAHALLDRARGDRAGASVARAGDLDGDGRPELLVGAYLADPTASGAGCAYLVPGGARGAVTDLAALPAPAREYDGARRLDTAGWAVAGIGDFNGDRRPDFAIAAPRTDLHKAQGGTLFVVYGRR